MTHNSQPLIYYIDTHLIFTKITIVRILKIVMTKSYVTVLFKTAIISPTGMGCQNLGKSHGFLSL